MMTALETLKNWLKTYPGHDILGEFQVDYTDQVPSNGGVFPSGLEEIARKTGGHVLNIVNGVIH